MNWTLLIGFISTVAGVLGYTLGIVAPYPGRAFTIIGVMVGITLLSIGVWGASGGLQI